MEDERDLVCRQHLQHCFDNDLIVCEKCERSWREHSEEGSCDSPLYYDKTFRRNINHPLINVRWARMRQYNINAIFNILNWSTVMNSAQTQDALQGWTENCWLIAAIGVLPRNRDTLVNVFPSYQDCPKGIYNVRLYSFGAWRNVLVDDFIPCDENFYPLYARIYRLWVALIEKAVAKFYGGYEALDGGILVESLNLLTGAPCSHLTISDEFGLRIHPDTLWNRLKYALNENYLILAGTAGFTKKADSDEEFNNLGLLKTHAYSLLGVTRVCNNRLIKLFNPHCLGQYTGHWSYNSLSDQLDLQYLLYQNCKEGEFWMGYNIFLEYFEGVSICKIRNDYNKVAVNGTITPLLLQKPSGIYFTIQTRTDVDFVLHQNTLRWIPLDERYLMDLFLIIFKKNRAGDYVYYKHSIRVVTTLLSIDLELYPGDYLIVPVTFNHFLNIFIDPSNTRCLLEVFTPGNVFMDSNWHPFDKLRETLVTIAKQYGKTNHYESAVVYEFAYCFAGIVVIIENKHCDRWLFAKSTYIGEPDMYESTRGAMITKDIIPPRHIQIVVVLTLNQGGHDVNATYFRHQFEILNEEQASQQPKHIPYINSFTDPLHMPYLLNEEDEEDEEDDE